MRVTIFSVLFLAISLPAFSQSMGLPDAPKIDPPKVDAPKVDPPPSPAGLLPDLVISLFAPSTDETTIPNSFDVSAHVKNIGGGPAVKVNVSVSVPEGTTTPTVLNADSRFTCAVSGKKLTCQDKTSPAPPPLLPGQTVRVQAQLSATAEGQLAFHAKADDLSRVPETSETNNDSSLSLTAVMRPKLKARSGSEENVVIGQAREVVCYADNIGQSPARNAKFSVTIASDQVWTLSAPDPLCGRRTAGDFKTDAFNCALGTIEVDQSGKIKLAITPKTPGKIVVKCRASADREDTPADNTAEHTLLGVKN